MFIDFETSSKSITWIIKLKLFLVIYLSYYLAIYLSEVRSRVQILNLSSVLRNLISTRTHHIRIYSQGFQISLDKRGWFEREEKLKITWHTFNSKRFFLRCTLYVIHIGSAILPLTSSVAPPPLLCTYLTLSSISHEIRQVFSFFATFSNF